MDVSGWIEAEGLHTLSIAVNNTETRKVMGAVSITLEYVE